MRSHFLGTGGAEGIPAMGCECNHCTRARQEGGRLVRQRSAVLFSLSGYELSLDTPPDIRELLETSDARTSHGIFLSHKHFDHAGGLEEFLYWNQGVDLFNESCMYQRLIRVNGGDRLADVTFHFAIHPGMGIRFNDFFFTPFEVRHTVPCFGLAIFEGQRRVAHAADTDRRLSNYARWLIQGAEVLIVNTPFFEPREEESHLSVWEAITMKDEVGANKVILTHANHSNLPHDELEAYVAQFEGITVAYDSLTVEV
jgi:phosphoribosyl 1,2-cyclic phosphate phosphodiesterase